MCEDKVRRVREGKGRGLTGQNERVRERKGEKESERKRVKESERDR